MIPAVEPGAASPAPRPRTRRAVLIDRWLRATCAALLMLLAAWELASIPVKAWLLPHVSLSSVLTTDPIAEVGLGAKAAFNHHRAEWLPLIWLVTTVSTIKWHLVVFWAGTLWGRDVLTRWSTNSSRQRRLLALIERVASRWPSVAILLTYVLMPLSSVIYATLGAANVPWRTLIKVDLAGAALSTFAWIYLGFYLGRPAQEALARYSSIATWVAIVLAVIVAAWVVWRYRTRDLRRIRAEVDAEARPVVAARLAEARREKGRARAERAAARAARRDVSAGRRPRSS